MHNNFIESMQNTLNVANPNVSITENGAVGYKTSGKSLVDLNFKLSSMRNMEPDAIWKEFLRSYNENPCLALVWLFFARDIRGGCGERRVFREIFVRFANENQKMAVNLLPLIPEYGRWDDLIWIYDKTTSLSLKMMIENMVGEQLDADYDACLAGKPISLLAKWCPSENASSKDTKRIAINLRLGIKMSPREYRVRLSTLRKYLDVVEQKISANEWDKINYESVPSKAGMNYRDAFDRHDRDRYREYLSDVGKGKANMNADVIFPYEIVHAYMSDSWYDDLKPMDDTLELKWKNLPNSELGETLVVVDGSGSMSCTIGTGSLTAHDVARSLGVYFSERLAGAFKDCFITFSANPKIVSFNGLKTLRGKLEYLIEEDECSNTNIERTFDLILKTAVDNHLKQDEIPANLLIISDMEFDSGSSSYNWTPSRYEHTSVSAALFDEIKAKWDMAGYKLPRLVFWNVNSRTGTIPVTENELGVALVSGFSPMIADMVMSGDLDPYAVLVHKLHSDRYDNVWKAVMQS